MLVPLSWLREFVDIPIPAEALAEKLTTAGLEVAKIHYLGVPQTHVEGIMQPPSDHLVWDRERLLLGAIREVKAHPNADKLVLAQVEIGGGVVEQCVTGAPNLFAYRDAGPLDPPLWTAFAAEGAEVWDGHSETRKRMILKEKPLRGIPNRSMVCSEYELGISDEHDGIILYHEPPRGPRGEHYPPGTPLADVLGDIVLEIELTPNLARCYSVYGVAREVAALLDLPLRPPSFEAVMEGAPIAGAAAITIMHPEYNPRFTLALLRETTVQPSPEWMQRRLRLVGQRPINNIVDVTNYITFEIGQPLHAFDYDKLKARAGGQPPALHTRLAHTGETLRTLDGAERTLDPFTVLVCDSVSALSIGGVIGGAETEIDGSTRNVLLEAAAWNFINIRRTMGAQRVFTDAGTRFSRGVHPAQAALGLLRGIELMRTSGGGQTAHGIIDAYPLPAPHVRVVLPVREITRLTGLQLDPATAAALLVRAGFAVSIEGETLTVDVPDDRLDISTDTVTGQADVIEEIVRIYGYDALPTRIMADATPVQQSTRHLDDEEQTRDVLVALGLREQISYRMTTPERESLFRPERETLFRPEREGLLQADAPLSDAGAQPTAAAHAPAGPLGAYVELANPATSDKRVMRQTLLVSLLENARANARFSPRQAVFEVGAVYFYPEARAEALPEEPRRLGLLLAGLRGAAAWDGAVAAGMADFFDLKGVVEGLLAGLHLNARGIAFVRPTEAESAVGADAAAFHPGRSAALVIDGQAIGLFGELHPRVTAAFGLSGAVLAAEFDLDRLLAFTNPLYRVRSLPLTPPILQDIALVVSADTPAQSVEAVIRKAGGALLREVRLFDVYTGESLGAGKKSLAYALTFQTDDRTLTDADAAKVREKIVKLAEREVGAALRGQ
jgi:phenylalanyl-tRNA synthetase beta chain